jgi:hypothetical protein
LVALLFAKNQLLRSWANREYTSVMSKDTSLLFFGGLVIVVSFLGIPSSWKTIVFSIIGVLIITTALFLRKDITSGALCLHLTEEKQTDSYKQNAVMRNNSIEISHENKKDTSKNISENKEDADAEKKEEDKKEYDQHPEESKS